MLRVGQRQEGQALIYGVFVLAAGLAALFFMFNTGQLSAEKTKLVNTADAVAYSAGVMHARALNYAAYTNRALIANEVLMAQLVSISSWLQYLDGHIEEVPAMQCYYWWSFPAAHNLKEYLPLCYALSWGGEYIAAALEMVEELPGAAATLAELSKTSLKAAQTAMYVALPVARNKVLQEVADANYRNDGAVSVESFPQRPLTDNFAQFAGKPFFRFYGDEERTRFRDTELAAAFMDSFVKDRSWASHSPIPCLPGPHASVVRTGGTALVDFDDWQANDEASARLEQWKASRFWSGCQTVAYYPLGEGSQSAQDWGYTGVPTFYELSDQALAEPDPRLKFAVRLTRSNTQARTSMGRSLVKPSGQLAIYQGAEAASVMAALATSEVYFERPVARADGQKELASLFNPYWQVHLISNSPADLATALALQGVGP